MVNKFDSVDSFKDVMKHTKAIVRKMNTSTKATERLITLSGKKLIKDCPTRWSSNFLLINRLLDVKDELKVVLDEQGWDDLAASKWRTLKNILHLFAKFTLLLSGDEFTTLLCVIPAIKDMNIHLHEVGNLLFVCCGLYNYLNYYNIMMYLYLCMTIFAE